jgi:hypothetical protein
MNWKPIAAEYIIPAVFIIALLAVLPQYLGTYFGFAGQFAGYLVSFVVIVPALWLSKRARRVIE